MKIPEQPLPDRARLAWLHLMHNTPCACMEYGRWHDFLPTMLALEILIPTSTNRRRSDCPWDELNYSKLKRTATC